MRLLLCAYQLDGQLLSQPIVREFDSGGGTVGRVDANTMALPDPQRHVSRVQARVLYFHGRFRLHNVGSNALRVDGRCVGCDDWAPLHEGSRLTVGGYELRATLSPEPSVPGELLASQGRQAH